MAVEHNGDLYSCDHFVYPEYKIGNITEDRIEELSQCPQQQQFGLDKKEKLPQYCRDCEFLKVCNGGCPKDRIIQTPDGEPGLNYLCEGYKRFYKHSLPVFKKMAQCIRMGYPASDYKHIR